MFEQFMMLIQLLLLLSAFNICGCLIEKRNSCIWFRFETFLHFPKWLYILVSINNTWYTVLFLERLLFQLKFIRHRDTRITLAMMWQIHDAIGITVIADEIHTRIRHFILLEQYLTLILLFFHTLLTIQMIDLEILCEKILKQYLTYSFLLLHIQFRRTLRILHLTFLLALKEWLSPRGWCSRLFCYISPKIFYRLWWFVVVVSFFLKILIEGHICDSRSWELFIIIWAITIITRCIHQSTLFCG